MVALAALDSTSRQTLTSPLACARQASRFCPNALGALSITGTTFLCRMDSANHITVSRCSVVYNSHLIKCAGCCALLSPEFE